MIKKEKENDKKKPNPVNPNFTKNANSMPKKLNPNFNFCNN